VNTSSESCQTSAAWRRSASWRSARAVSAVTHMSGSGSATFSSTKVSGTPAGGLSQPSHHVHHRPGPWQLRLLAAGSPPVALFMLGDRCSTCSAHNRAQSASSRWCSSVRVPPRRTVISRGSRSFGRMAHSHSYPARSDVAEGGMVARSARSADERMTSPSRPGVRTGSESGRPAPPPRPRSPSVAQCGTRSTAVVLARVR
jgi:hypothetical protein